MGPTTLSQTDEPKSKRRRRPAGDRRAQVLAAAERLVLDLGALPLPPNRLAEAAGISRASVYALFEDQHEMFNTLIAACFDELEAAGLAAAGAGPLRDAAPASAEIYFRHVASRGPVAHVILRDLYMACRLRPDLRRRRDRIAGRLARLARDEFALPAREAVGAFNLAVTIPEEAGRLVFEGELPFDAGLELCRRLVHSTLQALAKG